MSKYLITPSLINNFSYYMSDEWKSPADSRADFLKTLSREKFEPNESMKLGIKLEDVLKENLPNWKETTPKERQQICCSIARFWLKQTKEENES